MFVQKVKMKRFVKEKETNMSALSLEKIKTYGLSLIANVFTSSDMDSSDENGGLYGKCCSASSLGPLNIPPMLSRRL